MKWFVEISAISCAIYLAIVYLGSQDTVVPPKDYFIVETKEVESCIDSNRNIHVTKVTKQGKVEYN